jgi:hypothetical protein
LLVGYVAVAVHDAGIARGPAAAGQTVNVS